MLACRVTFLDESEVKLSLKNSSCGESLLDEVFKYLNLVERDYFGLKSDCTSYTNVWVKPNKQIKQQFSRKCHETLSFKFLVKFYPSDPSFVKEELTKYHLCLQMREDLLLKRLPCPLDTLAVLSSYWLQSEFGDDEGESNDLKHCLSSLRSISGERAISDFDEQVLKQYRSRKGMPAVDADTQFLRLACKLPLYGVHRYTAADKRGIECIVGVSSSGIVEITTKHEAVTYKWNYIKHINYKKNKFYLKILSSVSPGEKSVLKSFIFDSATQAKAFWQNAVDHHVFYRTTASDKTSTSSRQGSPTPDHRSSKLGKKRKLSFRLSFRKKRTKTEAEAREESSKIKRSNPTVVRHSSLRRSGSFKSDNSNSSTSETPPNTTKELRSILKNNSKVDSSSEDDDEGRPYTSEDIDVVCPTTLDVHKPSLLLAETIPEEDEDTTETASPTGVDCEIENDATRSNIGPREEVEVIVHEGNDCISDLEITNQPPALVIVLSNEMNKEEPASCIMQKGEDTSHHLEPPPLVQQLTKDALTPKAEDTEDELTNKESDTKFQGDELSAVCIKGLESVAQPSSVDTEAENAKSPLSTDTNNKITLPFQVKHDEEDDDDNKTIGESSAVATMGDDGVNFNDLIEEDGNIIRNGDVDGGSPVDTYSTKSSTSSISDLTNNTDELCNPNILDIIWSKCLGPDNDMKDVYHKLFGVKLRPTKGRLGNQKAKSTILENPQQRTVAVQVPPLPEERDKFRKFIPSWPFDPDSIASKSEIDELDRAAIDAALQGHVEYTEIRSKVKATVDAKFVATATDKNYRDVNEEQLDFPLFAKSVALYHLHSSTAGSSRTFSTTSDEETLSLPESPVSVEALKFPKPIKRFQAASDSEENKTLMYTPREDDPSPPEASDEELSGATNIKVKEGEKDTPRATTAVSGKPPQVSSNASSGRSSPAISSTSSTLSRSSFPRFIHSVFPLRKSSTSSTNENERGRARHRKNKKSPGTNKDDISPAHSLKSSAPSSDASDPGLEENAKETDEKVVIDDPHNVVGEEPLAVKHNANRKEETYLKTK